MVILPVFGLVSIWMNQKRLYIHSKLYLSHSSIVIRLCTTLCKHLDPLHFELFAKKRICSTSIANISDCQNWSLFVHIIKQSSNKVQMSKRMTTLDFAGVLSGAGLLYIIKIFQMWYIGVPGVSVIRYGLKWISKGDLGWCHKYKIPKN